MTSEPGRALDRTVLQVPLAEQIQRHLYFSQVKSTSLVTRHDYYMALALAVRDHLLHNWVETAEAYTQQGVRTAAYLSAEYLLGPHLDNNLVNLGMRAEAKAACQELGLDLDTLIACEPEPGLGNGGIGPFSSLLSGIAGQLGDASDRVRHPL